jgi:AcrR family transcriptional regulator
VAPSKKADRQPTSREQQRLETRRSLAEHAIRLFSEQGYYETTVEEIAAAAGVSARTFFLHFPTKAAAAFPDHDARAQDFITRLHAGAPHTNPLSQLRSVVDTGFEGESPSRLVRYRLLSEVPELRDEDARTDRDYEKAIAAYLILHWGESIETEVRANAIANAVSGVVRATLSAGGAYGIDPRAATAEILWRMFGSPFDDPLHSV